MTIAVSGVHTGNGTIGSAYLEAMAALDYRMFSGRNSIIHFGHVRDIKHHYYYPTERRSLSTMSEAAIWKILSSCLAASFCSSSKLSNPTMKAAKHRTLSDR
ncbi:hypothetical protein MKY82_15725 [Paenibacillus sp. FSL W7-1279]|uniref:hypothetical protein n=1 Tax=Paenibacillus sp. FSL W7-1279 TaxID=2921697 RepID=UPI0030DB3942